MRSRGRRPVAVLRVGVVVTGSREKLRDTFIHAWSMVEAHRLRGLDTTKLAEECHAAAGDMFAADAFDPKAEVAIRTLAVARASFAAAWPYLCEAWEEHTEDTAREAGHDIEVAFAKLERALKAGQR